MIVKNCFNVSRILLRRYIPNKICSNVNYSSIVTSDGMSLSDEIGRDKKGRDKKRRMASNINEWQSPIDVHRNITSKSNKGLNRVDATFYNQPCTDLAEELLGMILVRELQDGSVLKGQIVETECYLGGNDKASHSYGNKMTDRNEPMYMTPGTMYVYLTYGMYHMLNISSKEEGAAVLIRAVEPLEGIDFIRENRDQFTYKTSKRRLNVQPAQVRDFELCNGPAKLTIGFGIDMICNKQDLAKWPYMWIESGKEEIGENSIVKCKRIGIESAGEEWASKPLRFYIYKNKAVSKKDKAAEINLLEKLDPE